MLESRRAFRDALKVDEHAWTRAGWTLSLAMIALPYHRVRNPAAVRGTASFVAELPADFTASA